MPKKTVEGWVSGPKFTKIAGTEYPVLCSKMASDLEFEHRRGHFWPFFGFFEFFLHLPVCPWGGWVNSDFTFFV